jgi:glycine/serine hydroxymethyltransferase
MRQYSDLKPRSGSTANLAVYAMAIQRDSLLNCSFPFNFLSYSCAEELHLLQIRALPLIPF